MKCLSVRQPWAWAIISGLKTIENRSWSTRHRGPLAIHAGLSRAEYRLGFDFDRLMPGLPPAGDLAFGAIVGVVDVVDCVPYELVRDRLFAEPLGWCWILADPRPIELVPWRGQLGLFEVPDAIIREPVRGRLIAGTVSSFRQENLPIFHSP